MKNFMYKGKIYKVDTEGYLIDPDTWDEAFAEGMAPKVMIRHGLTEDHWKVINFIRNSFEKMNLCPLVYIACRQNNLGLGDLNRLFPTGYHRGACRLAGISYRQRFFQYYHLEENAQNIESNYKLKIYRIDAQGFLVDFLEWDENFAINKAFELKMPDLLTKKHWQVIYYLRDQFSKENTLPLIYEVCSTSQIELGELSRLFPDGYHRGAVKIAGLRLT